MGDVYVGGVGGWEVDLVRGEVGGRDGVEVEVGFCAVAWLVGVRWKVVGGRGHGAELAGAHELVHGAHVLDHGGVVRMCCTAEAATGVSAVAVVLRVVVGGVSVHLLHRHGDGWLEAGCHVIVYRGVEVERWRLHEVTTRLSHAIRRLLKMCRVWWEAGYMLRIML